jgi:hypothetical protein
MRIATLGALLLTLVTYPALLQAEVTRDCVLEGTVTKRPSADDRVYVAFHSYRPAEAGAECNIRKREKLQFKQPAASDINSAKPGSQVEYRYTEDSKTGTKWELRDVSRSS